VIQPFQKIKPNPSQRKNKTISKNQLARKKTYPKKTLEAKFSHKNYCLLLCCQSSFFFPNNFVETDVKKRMFYIFAKNPFQIEHFKHRFSKHET